MGVGTDDSGAIRALSWQASPGSIMYRRDMALEVLGTRNPRKYPPMNSNEAMLRRPPNSKRPVLRCSPVGRIS